MPVVFYKNGEQKVEVKEGTDLKKIIHENGWSIPLACEDGVCGVCLIKVLEGAENLTPVTDKEKMTLGAMGLNTGEFRLSCQCRVNGDVVIDVI